MKYCARMSVVAIGAILAVLLAGCTDSDEAPNVEAGANNTRCKTICDGGGCVTRCDNSNQYQVKSIKKMASYVAMATKANDAPALSGPIVITWVNETTVNMKGSVTGLIPGSSYMFHIHAGTDCAIDEVDGSKAAATQGKCFVGDPKVGCQWLKPTPRNSQAIADKDGKATWDYTSYKAQPQTPTLGHAVVFHRMYGNVMADTYDDANTPRMACGLVEKVSATDTSNKYQVKSIKKMASYMAKAAAAPGNKATDAPVLSGPVVITWVAKTTVNMKASVTGLVPGSSYMFHIHAGTDCAIEESDGSKAATTQGKCFVGSDGCQWLKPKPSNSQAKADKDGKATWDYTGYKAQPQTPTLGHAVVFHRMYGDVTRDTYDGPNTPRMACGLVEKMSTTTTTTMIPYQVKAIKKMASYAAMATKANDAPVLSGPIVITWVNETTVNMKGSVTGLVPGSSYMFHIHAGTDCAIDEVDGSKAAATQGKCFVGDPKVGCQWLKPTPRNSQAVADKDGKATWDYTSYKAQPQTPTLGHAVVFHRMYGNVMADTYDDANTPRMACGLVEKVSATDTSNKYQVKSIKKMASYMAKASAAPGNKATDAPVLSGPVVISWWSKTTVNMKASVTGLVPGSSYMFHIHAGTDCAIDESDGSKAATTQGKCFVGSDGCQWLKPKPSNSQAKADKDGKATWDYTSYKAQPQTPTLGHAVVFHRMYGDVTRDTYDGPNTPRMACGLVEK